MSMLHTLGLRIAPLALALTALTSPAAADTPVVGNYWSVPVIKSWLEASPSADDAAGKVTIHWLCKPKLDACRDDLARIFNMREQSNRVYVVAYINGTIKDAKKLDPVRGDVGAGAVAYGKPVAALMKDMGIGPSALPMAIVIGTDGKVAFVSTTGDPETLDKRDATINALVAAIHEYRLGASSPAGSVKVGQPFELGIQIELASWLRFAPDHPASLTLTPPPDVTCDATKLGPDRMRITGGKLEASVRCTAAVKGSYEARGLVRFDFVGPKRSVGFGDDGVLWKFEVRADPAVTPPKPTPSTPSTPTAPATPKPSAPTTRPPSAPAPTTPVAPIKP